jgi:hypothetical protein
MRKNKHFIIQSKPCYYLNEYFPLRYITAHSGYCQKTLQ